MEPQKTKAPRLVESLAYLHAKHVARAVMDVFKQNEDGMVGDPNYPAASSEFWTCNSQRRESLFARVRIRWCQLSGQTVEFFPYNEDFVCLLYLRIRKASTWHLEAWEFEVASAY